MVIGGIVLMRILINQVILRPKPLVNVTVTSTKRNKSNLLVFASILYHMLMEDWRTLPRDPSNQTHLVEYEKVKEAQPIFAGNEIICC